MSKVVIYTAGLCPYCHRAKELLRAKGVSFDEVDLTGRPGERDALCNKAGGRNKVPQIWIGEAHVGGCEDLHCLDRDGKLDALLGV